MPLGKYFQQSPVILLMSVSLIVLCLTKCIKEKSKFLSKLKYSENILCKLFFKHTERIIDITLFLVKFFKVSLFIFAVW